MDCYILGSLKILLLIILGYFAVVFNTFYKKRKIDLRNKVVVVTGASSGIGEALAHAFYDEGCKVVLAARRTQELMRVKENLINKKLSPESPEPLVLQLDLGKFEECATFAQKVEEACGHIDILINNGALTHRGSHLETNKEIHKLVMEVNYFGTVALTMAFLPKMVERGCGHIGIVGSMLSGMALPYRGPYCASKHALLAFADSLRAELHDHNIQVSVIHPGYVNTEISAKALHGTTGQPTGTIDKAAENGFPTERVAKRLLAMIVAQEKETILCQGFVRCALFLRRSFPSVYFYLISKWRD